jgi:IPT/TIG domain-containing protein
VTAQLLQTFQTSTTVPAGGIMTIAVTTSGVTITQTSPITGCPATGTGTSTVTYTCSTGSIPAGTAITQTFSIPSGGIAEMVTYNANGPSLGSPGATAPTTNNGFCTAATTIGGTSMCGGIATSVTTVPGGDLKITITRDAAAPTQTVTITNAPGTLGTCNLSIPPPSGTGTTEFITYHCNTTGLESIPLGTGITGIAVTTGVATGTPSIAASINDNAPIPAIAQIPAPTQQPLTFGTTASAPTITSISPASGIAGTVVTINGTNLTGLTAVNFGSTPGTNLNCSSSTSCTVIAPNLPANTAVTVTAVGPGGTSSGFQFTFSGTNPTPGGGPVVSLLSGWNLVGGPSGTVFSGASNPLYTWQTGDTNYQTLTPTSPITSGRGYWAYYPSATTTTIASATPQTIQVPLPVNNWIMVGNPGNTAATVSGADAVDIYSPVTNSYSTATTLQPGQGAWAISSTGATITIANQ